MPSKFSNSWNRRVSFISIFRKKNGDKKTWDYYLHNARRIVEIIVFSILRKFRIQDYYLQYVHLPSKLDQNLHNAHILKMKKQTNIVSERIQE